MSNGSPRALIALGHVVRKHCWTRDVTLQMNSDARGIQSENHFPVVFGCFRNWLAIVNDGIMKHKSHATRNMVQHRVHYSSIDKR